MVECLAGWPQGARVVYARSSGALLWFSGVQLVTYWSLVVRHAQEMFARGLAVLTMTTDSACCSEPGV